VQAKNTKSSPTDRTKTLAILAIKSRPRPTSRNSKGSPRARAVNKCGVGKIQFSANKLPYLRKVICLHTPVLATAESLSVCPSVTRWYRVKTAQAMITKSSPKDDKSMPTSGYSKGSPRARAINEFGVGKIQFSANKSPYLKKSYLGILKLKRV